MKLRLKERELPPVQLRLTLPGSLKDSLDDYVGYLHDKLQRDSDCKEVAIEMLKHFVESDRDFSNWRSRRAEESPGSSQAGKKNRAPGEENSGVGAMRS
jgi:hypothetical protein